MFGPGSAGLVSCHRTSLPAVDRNRGDSGLLDPPDQTDGVLQLKPGKNMKPVTDVVTVNASQVQR